MADPIRQLKQLPWISLFEMAALTVACVTATEYVLAWILQYSDTAMKVLVMLYAPPLTLGVVLMGVVVGTFAVYLTERMRSYVRLSAGVLWALVFCLVVTFWLKSILVTLISSMILIPNYLLPLEQLAIIGMLLGVFGKGQRYWR